MHTVYPVLKSRTFFILPAYNVAHSITILVRTLRGHGEVVVVDDGSSDGTGARARNAGATLITHVKNCGKGAALQSGLSYVRSRADNGTVVFMDADGQHNPNDALSLLRRFDQTKDNVIFGVRNLTSGAMPFLRQLWNQAMSLALFIFTGKYFSDSQCGFKIFPLSLAKELRIKERGYAVDTEILFLTLQENAHIVEVPIATIAEAPRSGIVADIKRAWHIFLRSCVLGGAFMWGRTGNVPASLWQQWHLVSAIIALVLVTTAFYQSFGARNRGGVAQRDSFGREIKATLEWLEENSDEGAIVMTPWFRGNQVITFANRPVIATTKVYPSEFREVAKRYKDIGAFFLAQDEEESLTIAERYNASYVFMPKDVRAWFCKANNQCEFAPNEGDLAPWAKEQTIAGLMTQGANFEHFKKIWDSTRFVIYKITDKEQGFPKEAQKTAVEIVRKTLEALLLENRMATAQDFEKFVEKRGFAALFSNPITVDVTIWHNQALRASRFGLGGTLLENLVSGALNAFQDQRYAPLQREDLADARIEIILFGDDRSPLDLYLIYTEPVDPSKGIVLTHGDTAAYFLPEIFNTIPAEEYPSLLDKLCLKGGFPKECYTNGAIEVALFSVQDMIETRDHRTILTFSGPLAITPDFFSQITLAQGARLAGESLLRNQRPDDSFIPVLNTLTGEPSERLDWVRDALSSEALVTLYQKTKDRRYLQAAVDNHTYLRKQLDLFKEHFPDKTIPTGFLNFGIRGALKLFDATKNRVFLDAAEKWTTTLYGLRRADGSFYSTFLTGGGKGTESATSTIVNYQAFTALTQWARHQKENSVTQEELVTLANIYQKEFRSQKILEEETLSLASAAWLVNGFSLLFELTGDESHADFALEVADWLALYQMRGDPYKAGAFYNQPGDPYIYTRGTSKITEALVDALMLAAKKGETYREKKYTVVLEEAFLWLLRMQIQAENDFWVAQSAQKNALGGFRHDLLNQEVWNDSAAHFLLGSTGYRNHVTN